MSEPRVPFHTFSMVPALEIIPNVSDFSGPGLGVKTHTGWVSGPAWYHSLGRSGMDGRFMEDWLFMTDSLTLAFGFTIRGKNRFNCCVGFFVILFKNYEIYHHTIPPHRNGHKYITRIIIKQTN